VNAFHVLGVIAALWAVLVTIIGLTKEDFPKGAAEKVVGAISVVIVAATISAAIITSANEEEEHGGGAEEAAESHSE
jgi:Mn2+/Fe2+ NRAMP family transporter